ncbi:MAG: cytochrome c-type biogenesis protein CcmH, partial [Chloroflexi bacterium]|nr:cytochrome c-type biogenesis protein CcmH [Chloroflexota bacterium]
MGFKSKLGIWLLVVLLSFYPARVFAATVNDVAKQLVCQCGCTMLVSDCDCETKVEMTSLIQQQVDQGKSEEQIFQFFVSKYGEKVLAAPTKQGFNLMAWIAPFAAILLGGGVIYFVLKKWVKQGQRSQTRAKPATGEKLKKYQNQLEKDLKEFSGG